ncbi:TonB-dependent receptor [Sphingomonas sp. KR3-1]|uniref:TonB-dependent receptor plug domain-containing protein n=1 Tax=Sphingomonas sp. KR3-1 TaxID=3156611 RepID=UPI0032B59837
MKNTQINLRGGTAVSALVLAGMLFATPAMAQDTTSGTAATPSTPATTDQQTSDDSNSIVVTGSLFRRTDTETTSPVTVLSSEDLQSKGITNTADAIRSISADNSGSIPTAFAAGFGSGSAAVSLRGLTVNSTLVLIDGIRTTNYPYADDGQRAFVDLNSIQRSTIDRIEVLKDGASSTYGADAIGGVVNIITRKEIKGIEGTAEGGVSRYGDGGEQRLSLTAGFGDLAEKGFNFYVSGEYEHDSLISVADRGFPYNTEDLSSIGGDNLNFGSPLFGAFGGRNAGITAVVRPARETTAGNIFSGQYIPDPATGADQLPFATRILSPNGQCTGTQITHTDGTGSYCEWNYAPYNTIQPEQTRYGGTAKLTANIGSNAQAYLTGTYYYSKVFSTANSFTARQRNPINTTNIVLPALLSNGSVNPYNPYAVAGCVEAVTCVDAQLAYNFGDIPNTATTINKLYRIAGGINGSFGDGWTYSFDATYAKSDLDGINQGYINIAGLENAINNGTYNFLNPSLNTQAVRDQVSPMAETKANSSLLMAQGVVTKDLFQLPGGALQLGVGGSIRRETLDNPNANANQAFLGLNAVTASGKRTITAAFFEFNAPILKSLEINGSGRYDHYSEGFNNFSPKVGIKFKPIPQLAVRGTYSRGFRAPSFAESFNGAVIGYTSATPPADVVAEHGNNAYVQSYSLGFNSASNPNLKPEKSRSFTAGAIFEPVRWLSFTVDYYNIKKTDVIAGGPLAGEAIDDYYSGTPLPAGYSVVLDDPDPQHPTARRKVLIVNSPYANASALLTSGLDVSATAKFNISPGFKWTSSVEATEIFEYNFKPSDTSPYDHYVGTQAPYVTSSGAGTPRWRGNWSNSFEIGDLTLTGTAYYTSGYKSVAEDQVGHGATTCADNLYGGSDPNFGCYAKHFITFDLVGQYKVNSQFTFYANVINLFDASAPLNPANYAGINYNPTYTQPGIVGRFFRAGANFKF